MPFDHGSPYQRSHDGTMYTTSFDPTSSLYGPMMGENGHQPYSTPETSPPTPSRRPEGVTTRSGMTIQKGTTAPAPKPPPTRTGRIEKAPPRKRKDRAGKNDKKTDIMQKPLSELALDYPNIIVADIGAYVNRSTEERLREVEQCKTPGKIKRPMNAFMLYRKAHQNLAKAHCTQNNHQVVSQVCGAAWPMEPDSVREQYNEWAKLERLNHQEAHPGYKFTPSKPKPKTQQDDDARSDEGDLDDFDWATGRASSRNQHRSRTPRTKHAVPVPMYHPQQMSHMNNGGMGLGLGVHQPAMYQYGQQGKPMQNQYTHGAMHSQPPYYQQNVHQRHDGQGFVEDVMLRRPQSPPMTYAPPPDNRYDLMSQYAPMTHTDFGLDTMIDPGLMGHDGTFGTGFADPLADSQHRWQGGAGLGIVDPRDGMADGLQPTLDDSFLHDTQMQLLRGQDSSWRVEELDGHFNDWLGQE
ncbi:HMG box protein [Plectosphaerella plurivora]|uniref:HMG box protein n=1 Tax=Plectosphaerella plurivora TaxID=936078 RepID=A0A9P8V7A0_9PEZI|nr:HMG box protein [Plectosphaerella plurivora]